MIISLLTYLAFSSTDARGMINLHISRACVVMEMPAIISLIR